MAWIGVSDRHMKALVVAAAFLAAIPVARADTETIVMLRHGEKPNVGLGQLDCQGLNRALKLPAILTAKFGRPAAIFAPNPSIRKDDEGTEFDYVRPLATIEPTAIRLGMPVNTQIGWSDIKGLQHQIEDKSLVAATVFIAWEHREIEDLAKSLLAAHGGDPVVVPKWHGENFDSIYVVLIDEGRARFTEDHEHLDGQPTNCPD
jgi:broad specificity phosphatase PhoE